MEVWSTGSGGSDGASGFETQTLNPKPFYYEMYCICSGTGFVPAQGFLGRALGFGFTLKLRVEFPLLGLGCHGLHCLRVPPTTSLITASASSLQCALTR